VRAVVMAGGRGMRMLPYTTVLPKPLLPVGDRPILAIILDQLARAGFVRADVCLGHLSELVRAYFAQVPPSNLRVELHTEDEPLGTAGALRTVPGLDGPFLTLNGDVLTSLDFNDLMRQHQASGAALTVGVQDRPTEVPSGVLELDGDLVTGYVEKPVLHHQVSLGVYALNAEALDHLGGGCVDFPDLVNVLLAERERVHAYRFNGAWFDIGSREGHELAIAQFNADPRAFLPAR
jgi:NDP-sugar pyrophosphorylase family protein